MFKIDNIPTSKSYANRALIYKFLYNKDLEIFNLPKSDDVVNLEKAIYAFENNERVINLGEGGTTIRFFLAAIACFDREVEIHVHPRFKKRPYKDFLLLLKKLGCDIEFLEGDGKLCKLQGPIKKNQSVEVDCEKTTQFYSALLLIQKHREMIIEPKNLSRSIPYVTMTKNVIFDLQSKKVLSIPVDWSSASYLLAYAALNQTSLFPQIKNISDDQADTSILEVFDQMGVKYSYSKDGLLVERVKRMKAYDISVSQCPDLTMTLVYLALFIEKECLVRDIETLIYKEVNRIDAIVLSLKSIGASYKIKDSSLYIYPSRELKRVDGFAPAMDHRIVMMNFLIDKQLGDYKVQEYPGVVSKSFKEFYSIINRLTFNN